MAETIRGAVTKADMNLAWRSLDGPRDLSCPVAVALGRITGRQWVVKSTCAWLFERERDTPGPELYRLPQPVRTFIKKWDSNAAYPHLWPDPIEFELRHVGFEVPANG